MLAFLSSILQNCLGSMAKQDSDHSYQSPGSLSVKWLKGHQRLKNPLNMMFTRKNALYSAGRKRYSRMLQHVYYAKPSAKEQTASYRSYDETPPPFFISMIISMII